MSKEIIPFKTLEIPKAIYAKWLNYTKAEEFTKQSHEQKFEALQGEETYPKTDQFLMMLCFSVCIGFALPAIIKDLPLLWLGPTGGAVLISVFISNKLKEKVYGKIIYERIAKSEAKAKLELADPINQEALAIKRDTVGLNQRLFEFNALLKRLDDFRPLNNDEMATYKLLAKERRQLGVKILDFDDKLRLPRAVEAVKILMAEPNVSRFELEKKMEEQRKKIDAETERYNKMQSLHTQLVRPRQ